MATKGKKVEIKTDTGALNPGAVAKRGTSTTSEEKPVEGTKVETTEGDETVPKEKPAKEYKDTVSQYGNKIGRPRVDESEIKKNYTLTMDQAQHDEVAKLAKKKHLSFSQFIALAVDSYLENMD